MIGENPSSWSSIVQKVEHAGMNKIDEQRKKQRLRKQKYREYLFYQMGQSTHQHQLSQSQKKTEKQEIQRINNQYKKTKIFMHNNLKKKEQDYQADNLHIIEEKRRKKAEEIRKNEWKKWKQNPFVKLLDGEEQRKRVLKQHFQQQLEINKKQQEIKQIHMREELKKKIAEKEQFQHYVEDTFKKKESQRQIFKHKYLGLQSHEKQKIKTQPDSLEKEYLQYLNFQSHEDRQKKKKSEKMEENLIKLNKNAQNLNSSPAYLGKTPNSYDRQRQLSYIDKGLELNRKNINNIRVASVPINESYKSDFQTEIKRMDMQLNSSYRNRSQQKKNNIFKQQDTQKILKQKQRSVFSQTNNPFSTQIQEVKCANMQQEKKEQKSFRCYNIISGRNNQYLFKY